MIAFRRFRLLRFVKTPQISGDVLTNQRRAPPIGKTGQTKNALICAAKCGTLSARKVRPQQGNIREWKDDYGLLSFGRYDGAIGYELAIAGAETYRVEETMRRVIEAYGTEGQAFAIPNCVAVSFVAQNTKPLTIMKRVGYHGNDLERIEKLNALSRRICAEVPELAGIERWTALA